MKHVVRKSDHVVVAVLDPKSNTARYTDHYFRKGDHLDLSHIWRYEGRDLVDDGPRPDPGAAARDAAKLAREQLRTLDITTAGFDQKQLDYLKLILRAMGIKPGGPEPK